MEVEDLFTDLADGIKLLKLLEIISSEKLGKPNSGRMRVHKIENVNKSLAFLHTKVRGSSPEESQVESNGDWTVESGECWGRELYYAFVESASRACAAARGRCVLCLPHELS